MRDEDTSNLGRRAFVLATSATAVATVLPTTADAATPKRVLVDELRRQLNLQTKLKSTQITAIVRRAKDLLPFLGDISAGHVVIGVRLDSEGEVMGVSECKDGHSCAGTFQAEPQPTCNANATGCDAEACKVQSCDGHWCESNSCDTESCERNVCEEQACDTEACNNQSCDANTDTDVMASMSKSSGWKTIQANIAALKKAGELEVTVVVQNP